MRFCDFDRSLTLHAHRCGAAFQADDATQQSVKNFLCPFLRDHAPITSGNIFIADHCCRVQSRFCTVHRGLHESTELTCQHAEALLLQNAGADTLRIVQAAIVSLLQPHS